MPKTPSLTPEEEKELAQKGRKKKKRRLTNVRVHEVSLVDRPAVPQAVFTLIKRDPEMAEPAYPELAKTLGEKPDNPTPEGDPPDNPAEPPAETQLQKFSWEYGGEPLELELTPDDLEAGGEVMAVLCKSVNDLAEMEDRSAVVDATIGCMIEAMRLLKSNEGIKENPIELAKGINARILAPKDFAKIEQAQELLGGVIKSARKITKSASEEPAGEIPPVETPPEPVADPPQETAPISDLEKAGELLQARQLEKAKQRADAAEEKAKEALLSFSDRLDALTAKAGKLSDDLALASGKVE